jgi:hypothetical protein
MRRRFSSQVVPFVCPPEIAKIRASGTSFMPRLCRASGMLHSGESSRWTRGGQLRSSPARGDRLRPELKDCADLKFLAIAGAAWLLSYGGHKTKWPLG